jgi:hypothetical protein
MSIDQLPSFTAPARQRWDAIPARIRSQLLSNVWCSHCRNEVSIKNFTGTMEGADLLLVGQCAACDGEVARVIEA